jgi:GNAT superfamily N-acetyltransferase
MPVSRTAVVPVEEIFALRWAVLRTGLPRETAIYPEDARPGTFHVAAYDESGTVQGCATFFPDALPGEAGDTSRRSQGGGTSRRSQGGGTSRRSQGEAYRFRGMGSAPEVRGQGFGGAALTAGLRESAARGAAVVWCNGRIAATGFYHHLGFTAVGEEFTIEPSGPHYVFVTKDLDRP